MKEKPLSPKLVRFCCNIISGMSGKDAAINAGYPFKSAYATASKLLSRDVVKKFIDSKLVQDKVVITATEILEGIKLNATHNQKLRKGKMLDPHASNKAYELLGKHQKLFVDKVEHSIDQDAFERLENSRKRAYNETK